MEFKVQLEEIQHEHPLTLIDLQDMYEGYDDDFEDSDLIAMQQFKCICERCGLGVDWYHRYYYKCSSMSCSYSLHKYCAEISTTLQSPAHPDHTLILKKSTTNWRCGGCHTSYHDGICYHCSICNFDIDLGCAKFSDQKTIHHPRHPHPLISVTVEPILATCFACGKEKQGDFYHCATCFKFVVHSDCLSLPIKLLLESHHPHMLTLSSSSSVDQVYGCECRICENEINSEYWLYVCSKCMFYAHVDCAIKPLHAGTEEYRTAKLVFPENKIFNKSGDTMYNPISEEAFNSLPQRIPEHKSSLCFDESTNENGYLEHFSHKHPLVLIHNQSNYDTSRVKLVPLHDPMKMVKRLCNGCVRPVTSMPFYMCSRDYVECSNFILHEWCARLRREISFFALRMEKKYVLRQSCSLFSCKICGLPCNGFAYISDNSPLGQIDVHCAHIPRWIQHEAAGHLLSRFDPSDSGFYNFKLSEIYECRACRCIIKKGDIIYYDGQYGYDFFLHTSCALFLTKTIRHKYDKHPLKLSYTPVENYKTQYFCEVCEEDLDPTKWFYHCSKCSQSIHSDCAPLILKSEQGVNSSHDDLVYKFINMKFGDVRNTDDHEHPVSFVAGTKIDGDCTKCGLELQSKFILKCLRCKFAIHSYCESSITASEKQELVEIFSNLEKKHEPKRKPQPPRVVTFYPKRITRPVIE